MWYDLLYGNSGHVSVSLITFIHANSYKLAIFVDKNTAISYSVRNDVDQFKRVDPYHFFIEMVHIACVLIAISSSAITKLHNYIINSLWHRYLQ